MEAFKDKIKFKRYPDYKESGVKWLGQIPEHWGTLANKYIFKLKKNQVGKKSGDYILLSLTLNGVIIRDMINPQGKFPAEFDTYQEVKKGDFIFCLFDVEETPRTVGLSDYDGMITGAYTVMQPNDNFDRSFLYYFYLNLDADKRMKPLYTGLRNTISKENFFAFKTFVPTLKEQAAIASFLDHKTTQINQAIAQKERMIELLKERRQILIQNAVTKGFDPNVKMKNSGVDWIGEIPELWEVKRLKNFIKDLVSGVSVNASESESAENGELGVLKTSCVYRYVFEHFENKKVFQADLRRVSCPVKANSIIISRMNAPELVGASGYVAVDYPNLFLPDRLWQTVFYEEGNMNVYWLSKVLITRGFRNCITAIANGSSPSMKNISKGEFLNLKIAVPPIDEQDQIVSAIETNSSKIATAISLKEQEIEKLKEYKATLINSAVTGKIKVS
jgi:type I restriction enzyme S subunit